MEDIDQLAKSVAELERRIATIESSRLAHIAAIDGRQIATDDLTAWIMPLREVPLPLM